MTSAIRANWMLAVLLTGQFMANVDVAIVNVSAPSMLTSLHASGSALQLVIAGYMLTYASLLITGARLGDMYGHRFTFLTGLSVFTLASFACGLAPNAPALIAARLFQGAGAALMVPQVLSGIQLHFAGSARARALGYYAIALSGGAVAGQVLGGVIIAMNIFGSEWRPVFLINVPIGIVLFIAGRMFLDEDRAKHGARLDIAGVVLLACTVLLVIIPLVFGPGDRWATWNWVMLAAAFPAFAAFIAWERRVARTSGYPLINLSLFADPVVRLGLFALGTATMTYYSLLFTLALYLQQGLGKTPLYSGLALVSWVAAFGIAGPVLPRVPSRLAPFAAPFGQLILATAYAAVSVAVFAGHGAGIVLFALLGVGGFGLGAGFASLVTTVTKAVPRDFAPDLSGVLTTMSQIAAVFGIATFGTLYVVLAPRPGAIAGTHAFAIVTLAFALTALAAALAAYACARRSAQRAETALESVA